MTWNVVYHYAPLFRRYIFDAMSASKQTDYRFLYGANARMSVKTLSAPEHNIRRNFYLGGFIFQSLGWSDLRSIARSPSIILGDIKFVNAWLYALIGRACGRKVFFWTHGILEPESGIKWFLRRMFYGIASGLLLYSDREKKLLEDCGCRTPMYVIGNSNFTESQVTEETPSPDGQNCFYVGRITSDKNLNNHVEFAQRYPQRKVLIVGDGPGKEKLTSEIAKSTCQNIQVKDAAYDEAELSRLLEGFDNLLFFSPIGLSCFTAVQLGKRIFVQSGINHKPEFHLLQSYGLIVEFDNLEDLDEKLRQPPPTTPGFADQRRLFLKENSSEQVAYRIERAISNGQGSTLQ